MHALLAVRALESGASFIRWMGTETKVATAAATITTCGRRGVVTLVDWPV